VDGAVVLCGLGLVGSRVLAYLKAAGVPTVVIDQKASPDDRRLDGARLIKGDFRDEAILEQADVRSARGILILTSDDLANIYGALVIRRLNPNVRIVLRMYNQNLLTRLGKAVNNVFALSVSALAAPILALTAMTGEVLGAFSIGPGRRQIIHITIPDNSLFLGQTIAEASQKGKFLFFAHTPQGQSSQILLDIHPDTVIREGDRVVLCGEPNDVRTLLDPSKTEMDDVLWAGRLRRWWRTLRRGWSEMDLAVKICSLTLLAVCVTSASIYHYGMNETWSDGIYHTISVMATGADMGGTNYEGWGKVFVSALRLIGAALIAAFTAIVTNSLLRARFAGAFEVRKIPEKGHFVICGLGNVGYRVVEEFVKADERVAVVEQRADNTLVAMCRSKGVPVVIGDATMIDTLRQARTDTARAVISCTENDLANLEIALLVTEMNPKQRVVVRLGDSTLAETIRQAANVRLALSVPDLAAPAFVAGLFGDRVQVMFQVSGQMLTVLELAISEDDTQLNNHSLHALAIDYGFIPISVLDDRQSIHEVGSSYRLRPGDHLMVAAKLTDVERLLRREPVELNWRVEVQSFPLPAREHLLTQVSAFRKLSTKEAEDWIQQTPFVLTENLSHGQADELVKLLQRERIIAVARN
jgi:Trk K+ transport system NAD-binding subunit